jgi:outer membrane protein assembly factor BamB
MANNLLLRLRGRTTALVGLLLGMGLCLGMLAPAIPAAAVTTPTITSFTPTSGTVGTSVAITGTNLNLATGVKFNGVPANFLVVSSTLIGAVVPPMATSGPIVVTYGTGSLFVGSAQSFTVIPAIALSPTTGPPGSTVTVSGTGFGRDKVNISFDGTVLAQNINVSGSFAKSIIIPAATGGTHSIVAQGIVADSAQASFTVTPAITVSPATGPPTSKLAVSGSGFGGSEGVDIYFDTTDLVLPGTDANGSFGPISITVPASAAPGTHWITAEGRHSGLLTQAPFAVNTNWGQFRYSSKHRGSNPYENVLNRDNVSAIDQDWSFTTGGQVQSSPAISNEMAYVGSFDGTVYALDASTGAQQWSFPTGGLIRSSPAVAKGVVYVGSDDSNLYALNASSGAELWSFPTGGEFDSSPAVANGVVYVGSLGGNVYALNASTGAQLWSFATGGFVRSSPAVVNGVVYVGSDDGKVYALNASTGAQLWNFTTGNGVVSSPAVVNGVVYVGSEDGNVYALNSSTGALLWSHATGAGIESSPAVANGVVYIGSTDRSLYAFKASTGAVLWSVITGSGIQSSPAVANGVVYIGSNDGNVYAFNTATGDQLWSYATGDSVVSSPL